MSAELDLDDVAAGHPRAMRELAELRSAVDAREAELNRVNEAFDLAESGCFVSGHPVRADLDPESENFWFQRIVNITDTQVAATKGGLESAAVLSKTVGLAFINLKRRLAEAREEAKYLRQQRNELRAREHEAGVVDARELWILLAIREIVEPVVGRLMQNELVESIRVLAADAERYRRMRHPHPRLEVRYWTGEYWEPLYGEGCDDRIDAIIAESGGVRAAQEKAE